MEPANIKEYGHHNKIGKRRISNRTDPTYGEELYNFAGMINIFPFKSCLGLEEKIKWKVTDLIKIITEILMRCSSWSQRGLEGTDKSKINIVRIVSQTRD